ncbi:hypothetical protein Vi05172_g7776 [Venturia inaequalis]|uniref:DUF6604 domain-containing protein n=1 Tax=Venturia inaequalis TaxID=5025 RepID=A0A8H3VSC0_VENIN|nr:hypothetical protein EG327_004137 [Venturia inaequalis]RDI82070.1 hypothetical protein Vi05172_g7776 [Venturia inaequalis]
MSSEFLSSSYSRYKEDTTTFAKWLACTAQAVGYSEDSFTDRTNSGKLAPPTGRLKGKARKEAKMMVGKESKEKTYTVSVRDFTKISRYIASHQPSLIVPPTIFHTLDRAISVRKAHTAWYANFAKECDQHMHFVKVLEEVRNILHPLLRKRTSRAPTKPSLASSANQENQQPTTTLHTRFDLLGMEDLPDDDDASNDDSPAPPSVSAAQNGNTVTHVQVVIPNDDQLAEQHFKVWCFFEDLNSLRSLIEKTWTDYHDEKLDLIPATLTTNIAVDLVRSMEAELQQSCSLDCHKLVWMCYEGCCKSSKKDPNFKHLPDDKFNFDALYPAADRSLLAMETHLLACRGAKANQRPDVRPRSIPSSMTPRERFRNDQKLLSDYFLSVAELPRPFFPSEDEFTKLSGQFDFDGKMTMPLLFATDAYLTAQNIVQSDRIASKDFHRIGGQFRDTLQANLDFHKGLNLDSQVIQHDKNIQEILRVEVDKWTASPRNHLQNISTIEDMLYSWSEQDICDAAVLRKEMILERNPMLCGTMAARFKLLHHEHGIAMANHFSSILHVFHLYNAVQQEGLLQEPFKTWKTLEMVVEHIGESGVFSGGRPKGVVNYYKQLCLLQGQSILNFANNRRVIPFKFARSKKTLRTSAPITFTFKHWILNEGPRNSLTVSDVETIVEKAQIVTAKRLDKSGPKSTPEFPQQHVTEDQPKVEKKLRKLWEKHHKYTPDELLLNLQTVLQDETSELFLDYLLLDRVCTKVLKVLKDKFGDELLSRYDPGCIRNDTQLCRMANLIFMAALDPTMNRYNDGRGFKILTEVGKVITSVIQTTGDQQSLFANPDGSRNAAEACDGPEPKEAKAKSFFEDDLDPSKAGDHFEGVHGKRLKKQFKTVVAEIRQMKGGKKSAGTVADD